ncbi:uncharacterized protein AMSG_03836 [Thecamonas trahens ATCC 50062]|uniref:AB hydrolase-1 domain-containing protein n=1 Tax=Thecamonas trahens ATCC 50062 TaxID=461836 RepID=A0A0L0D4V6_THETB|nr:hypothetical protein AMSG_03836 [Thecamonas trahens ATCC 50062]KNC47402.1 hypothetical protein AMSG_03836 [Thecamonas trahens ATCC 50062]|eukprot:XP_013759740.1 hypothetical protein AMSG_03836 [Thecamonas trahens ATCC 50062]
MEVIRVRVGGVVTQVLQHPEARVLLPPDAEAPAEPPSTVLLLVPGNPGIVSFYEPFLLALYAAWGGKVAVAAVSHVGHIAGLPNEVEVPSLDLPFASHIAGEPQLAPTRLSWDLESQIAHKSAILRAIAESPATAAAPKFVLAGHSIGAHIVTQLMLQSASAAGAASGEAAAPGVDIIRGINLFPTLHSMKEHAGVLNYVTLPGLRHAAAAAVAVMGALPGRLVKPVMRMASDAAADDRTADIVLSSFSFSTAAAVLGMARTEFVTVNAVPDLSPIIDDLVFYYGVDDGWAPINHAHMTREAYPDHPHVYIDATGAPHAFVVDSSEDVAAELVRLLKGDLFPADPSPAS